MCFLKQIDEKIRKMKNRNIFKTQLPFWVIILSIWSCSVPKQTVMEVNKVTPQNYSSKFIDSINVADINWKDYFKDPYLISLIDTALSNNQELNIVLQEIAIGKNEILEKEGEYMPFVNLGVGIGAEKPGRYTRDGAVEHELKIESDKEFPEPLGDFLIGATASWEIDIWKKLRNAKSSAELRFLASNEAKNFLVTNLIAEISDGYYELMALDNLLMIINRNMNIQSEALKKVQLQKDNAKATQLAVNRFSAQLLNTKNLQFEIKQKLVETENHLNFLVGRYPQKIERNANIFMDLQLDSIQTGLPAQLLQNRPDIKQLEYELMASKLDIQVARADFYPSVGLTSEIGFQAFNPKFLLNPESILFNLAGDLMAPLVNKKAIRARYNSATSTQIQKVYEYEQALLQAYADVVNELSKLQNYSKSFEAKKQEVEILNESVSIANNLFRYARADYVEVLLTQEEVLDSKMELVEIKLKQLNAKVQIYRALGGGWK
jgi:NodT family efflux transporter outer membrane factor (OMF) lipoprotein